MISLLRGPDFHFGQVIYIKALAVSRDTSRLSLTMSKEAKEGANDDQELERLGYVPSFKREFSNLATVCMLEANTLMCY